MTIPLIISWKSFKLLVIWSLHPNQTHWILGELYGAVYGAQFRELGSGSLLCVNLKW